MRQPTWDLPETLNPWVKKLHRDRDMMHQSHPSTMHTQAFVYDDIHVLGDLTTRSQVPNVTERD